MKKISTLFLFLGLLCIASCSDDSQSDLTEQQNPNPNPDPDPTPDPQDITYANTVQAIMSNSCTGCHADPPRNGAPFSLTTYNNVLSSANSGGLLSSIQKQTGESGAMPPSGRLPQATIDQITQWIEDGSKEN